MLENCKIDVDWVLLYIGFKNHYINSKEILKYYYNEKLPTLGSNLVVDLEIYQDSEEMFIGLLEEIAKNNCSDFEVDKKKASKKWETIFLLEIANSKKSIKEKLVEIESLWAWFNYPMEWRSFIYYLPNENMDKSDGAVYKKFLGYLQTLN